VIATEAKDPTRDLGDFKWGLVPSWAKDPPIGNRMINARAEGRIDRVNDVEIGGDPAAVPVGARVAVRQVAGFVW
jgi:hypothetical protein